MARPQYRNGKWRFRWVDPVSGVRSSRTFSNKDEAELFARERELEALRFRTGHAPAPTGERTYAQLVDYWREYRYPEKRSAKHDESIFRCHLLPAFGKMRLRDITVERVNVFKANFPGGPKTLHNVLTLLIATLNQAVDLEWLARCPAIKKPKLPQQDFSFLRTRDEIARFLAAAEVEGPCDGAFGRSLLVRFQRPVWRWVE